MSQGSDDAAAVAVTAAAAPNAGTAIATASRQAASLARRPSMDIKRIKILRRWSCVGSAPRRRNADRNGHAAQGVAAQCDVQVNNAYCCDVAHILSRPSG
jgi:hypothetical protein